MTCAISAELASISNMDSGNGGEALRNCSAADAARLKQPFAVTCTASGKQQAPLTPCSQLGLADGSLFETHHEKHVDAPHVDALDDLPGGAHSRQRYWNCTHK